MRRFTLRAEGITSDLAQGSAGAAVLTRERAGQERIAAGPCSQSTPVPSEQVATLLAATDTLKAFGALAAPGDRIRITSRFGDRLPFSGEANALQAPVRAAVSDLSIAVGQLQDKGIRIHFESDDRGADPVLVRQATLALMSSRRRKTAHAA